MSLITKIDPNKKANIRRMFKANMNAKPGLGARRVTSALLTQLNGLNGYENLTSEQLTEILNTRGRNDDPISSSLDSSGDVTSWDKALAVMPGSDRPVRVAILSDGKLAPPRQGMFFDGRLYVECDSRAASTTH